MTIDKKKIIGIVLAVLAGAAAAGVVLWQPWNRADPPEKDPVQRIEEEDPPQAPAEKGPSLTVDGEEIACTLYEGDGWSICVPEGWTVRTGPGGMWMTCGETVVEVWRESTADCGRAFASISASENRAMERMFYLADGAGGSWEVRCGASAEADWTENERLMIEIARSFETDGEKPFAGWRALPGEPDWQEAEGMTVLFMDKDGVILDEEAGKAVEAYMASWPEETRSLFTGQYRVEGITWDSSYTELTGGYIDVFRAEVSYELSAEGGEAVADWEFPVPDGYAQPPAGLLAVYHDGGSVERTRWLDGGAAESWPALAGLLAE